jgi:hypothetical protein
VFLRGHVRTRRDCGEFLSNKIQQLLSGGVKPPDTPFRHHEIAIVATGVEKAALFSSDQRGCLNLRAAQQFVVPETSWAFVDMSGQMLRAGLKHAT